MPEAVIVSVARSPIGRAMKGSLVEFRPDDLAALMVREALAKVPALDPATLDDLMLGCGQPAGEGGFNMARVVAVLAGLDGVPGVTVNRYCSSSLQTTRMAFHAIKAGEGHAFVSAGVETVSRFAGGFADGGAQNPRFAAASARSAQRATGVAHAWTDPRDAGDLPDVYIAMGQTAENVAQVIGMSRQEQDAFGVRSQNLAEAAIANGFWATDIVPVTTPSGTVVSKDDGPRPGRLPRVAFPDSEDPMKVWFDCTAAAHPLVLRPVIERFRERGAEVLVTARENGETVGNLERLGIDHLVVGKHGGASKIGKALALAGMTIDDIDLAEINEAFAVQALGSAQQLGIRLEKLNVNGGAIAVGHPFGMTGARITSTLVNSLAFHDKQIGLETMCVGGGQGMAMIIERLA